MNVHAIVVRVAAPASCTACLVVGGCASPPPAPHDAARVIIPADSGRFVTAAELDELTRAFADRYVGLLYSACDELKKDNSDPVQRREANALLVDCSSNIYDIASNADSFTRLLDLVVVTNLTSQVWVDDGRAAKIFGPRAQLLSHAMIHARTEAQALAERVLTDEQLTTLSALLSDWRIENPEMIRASFVRFSNFAIGRGRSAASEVLAARGFLREVEQASQSVDEARLLGERIFYLLKREPTLLRWQIAAAQDDVLATPQFASVVGDLHRVADQIEQLPAHIATEREAILAAVDSRLASVNETVLNAKDVATETRALVESLEPASESLAKLFETADTLFARYDEWDRWSFAVQTRPYDIREYTEIVKESATTAERLNEAIASSNDLLGSPDWPTRVNEWTRSADGRIETLATQSRLLLDDFFRRVYYAFGAFFILLVCYRIISIILVRWLSARDTTPGPPPSGAIKSKS